MDFQGKEEVQTVRYAAGQDKDIVSCIFCQKEAMRELGLLFGHKLSHWKFKKFMWSSIVSEETANPLSKSQLVKFKCAGP